MRLVRAIQSAGRIRPGENHFPCRGNDEPALGNDENCFGKRRNFFGYGTQRRDGTGELQENCLKCRSARVCRAKSHSQAVNPVGVSFNPVGLSRIQSSFAFSARAGSVGEPTIVVSKRSIAGITSSAPQQPKKSVRPIPLARQSRDRREQRVGQAASSRRRRHRSTRE